jgi:hypothetical protein
MTTDPMIFADPSLTGTRRLFLREPGWRVGHKSGNSKEFCFMRNPGQDYYHRLLDGEIYIFSGEERLCIACACRRGLLSHEAKLLREPGIKIEFEETADQDPFDVCGDEDD